MTAQIIDGKVFANQLCERVAQDVNLLKSEKNITPGLATVLVGDDPASHVYVKNKRARTQEVGMRSFHHELPATATQEVLLNKVRELNEDASVHGILVQLPLPSHMDENAVINAIDPAKDVDGFHAVNTGKLVAADDSALVPCTPQGCLMMLRDVFSSLRGSEASAAISSHQTQEIAASACSSALPLHPRNDGLAGKHAVVVGASNIVGKPMASLLLNERCTVTICHSKTKDVAEECRRADILVVAVGRPEMVKADWVKPGAVVIDVGINRIETGELKEDGTVKTRLVGDVDFEGTKQVASAITPVPGGVGPMTIACLLANTLKAAKA